ncbi:MAG: metallophosphoesterase [Pseudomonadota bacterium]
MTRPSPARYAVALIAFLTVAGCADASKGNPGSTNAAITDDLPRVPEGGFAFIVIGDTPYGAKDDIMLGRAAPAIKAGGFPFIIHVGDYKGGRAVCAPSYDEAFLAFVDDFAPTPTFYTPGDNEWTDCDRHKNPETGARYSDLARLEVVRGHYVRTDGPAVAGVTPPEMRAESQPSLIENATWVHGGVRFLTLHATGTNNGRDWVTGDPLEAADAAHDERDAANLAWLASGFEKAADEKARAVVVAMHGDPTALKGKIVGEPCDGTAASDDHPCDAFAELRAALRQAAADYGGPTLVIHGDTAPFTLNQDFAGDEAPNIWRLNAAGDAGIGATGQSYGTRDVVRVVVDPADVEAPFSAIGLTTGKAAKRR